jgi:hypothetical protein
VGTTHYRRNENTKTSGTQPQKTGFKNINKEDTSMVWTNGQRPKKRRVLKIKIIIILKTKFKNKLF